jgi:catechol 2,3-dioxygenase-like lactoylglutathione lyase family enzyme
MSESERPVLDQINVVVRDMDAMVAFYERLGCPIANYEPAWDRHHRTVSTGGELDFDLDSETFASQWNSGRPAGKTGPVLGFRLASREAVDATYRDLTDAGYAGEQPPYDAFWGARYAIVADPDGNSVGLMSPSDPARRNSPPPPD